MKMKKIAAALCAAALALALPMSAFAVESPNGSMSSASDGDVTCYASTNADIAPMKSAPTPDAAKAAAGSANILGTFSVENATFEGAVPVSAENPLTLLFSCPDYVGKDVYVYVVHGTDINASGFKASVKDGKVNSNGFASYTTDKLSFFTLIEGKLGTSSPKTGVDNTAVAAITLASAVMAGAVVFAIRRTSKEQ